MRAVGLNEALGFGKFPPQPLWFDTDGESKMITKWTRKAVSISLALAMLVVAPCVWAHDGEHPEKPNPSPNATVSQEVGYGKVTVDFGRPGVKGRRGKIWGELLKYNDGEPKPWLAGANGNAIITFAEDVKVNGHDIAAGSYGLMMIPSEKSWVIIFSKNSNKLGILKYTKEEDALRIEVAPKRADYQEWLIYEFEKRSDLSALLNLHWENLKVGFEIVAADHREAEASKDEKH
jgi:hypothetical protein